MGPPGVLPPRRQAGSVLVKGESQSQRIARAKGYPYPRPDTSFVFVSSAAGAAWHPVANGAWRRAASGGAPAPAAVLKVPIGAAAAVATPGAAPVSRGPTTRSRSALASAAVATAGSSSDLAAAAAAANSGGGSSDGSEQLHGTLGDALLRLHGVDAAALLPPGTPLTPILAIGSNASPEQLARKFPPSLFPGGAVVPVVQCVLRGFDVVYAPLLSSYGSATATLEASPGTDVEVFITLLTPPLQQRMHETEGAYDLLRLDSIELFEGASLQELASGGARDSRPLGSVYQYNHSLGTLHLPLATPAGGAAAGTGASPVALAEIPARNRRFPALSQVEMQAALMRGFAAGASSGSDASGSGGRSASASASEDDQEQVLAPVALESAVAASASGSNAPGGGGGGGGGSGGSGGGSGGDALEDFILSNLNEHGVRAARVAGLAAHARPFAFAAAERLMTLGTMFSRNVD